MYNFTKPIKFVKPKKPNKTSGVVVLNTDDGEVRNYTHWMPWFWAYKMQNNQFIDNKPLRGLSPNINTAFVGGMTQGNGRPMMNWEQIKHMYRLGSDMQSHGRKHLYLSYLSLQKDVSAGETFIEYDRSNNAIKSGVSYLIEENGIVERVVIKEHRVDEQGLAELVDPLTNSFTTNATIHITEESAFEDLQGCLDDLHEQGLDAKHHVNPWYNSSNRTREWQKEIFIGVLSAMRDIDKPEDVVLDSIRRSPKAIPLLTYNEIDEYLLETRKNDGALFIVGHGETNEKTRENMKYLISKASDLGVEFVTHDEAVQHLIDKGAK